MLGESSPNIFETNKNKKIKKGKIKMKKNIINVVNKIIVLVGLVVPSLIMAYLLAISYYTYSEQTAFNSCIWGLAMALVFVATNTNNIQFTGMKSVRSRIKHIMRNALIGFLITVTTGAIGSIALLEYGDMSIMSAVVGTMAAVKNLVFEALLPYRVEAI